MLEDNAREVELAAEHYIRRESWPHAEQAKREDELAMEQTNELAMEKAIEEERRR